jgi:hypothetical protein
VAKQKEQALQPSNSVSRTFTDPHQRWRLVLPKQAVVRTTRFDPSTPVHKVKERLEILSDDRLVLRIDIWTNPEDLSPLGWIDTHATYLRNQEITLQQSYIGPENRLVVLADQPRSCQSSHIITAFLSVGKSMVSMTCVDGDDPSQRTIFENALVSFAAGEQP